MTFATTPTTASPIMATASAGIARPKSTSGTRTRKSGNVSSSRVFFVCFSCPCLPCLCFCLLTNVLPDLVSCDVMLMNATRCAHPVCQEGHLPHVVGHEGRDRAAGTSLAH